MNIVVFVKPVPNPDYYDKITIDTKTKRLVRDGIPTVINQADKCALEHALQIKENNGGTVTVISMAPMFNAYEMEKCLALGADNAYLVSDRAFGGADTWATSYTLTKALEKTGIKADLILAGNDSADGATSHVPSQVGEWLSLPHLSNITSIADVSKESVKASKLIETGSILYEVKLPAVLAVTKNSIEPRLMSAYGVKSLRNKEVTVFTKDDLPVDESKIGLVGSPTQPGEIMVHNMKRNSVALDGTESEIAQQLIDIFKKAGVKVDGGEIPC